MGGRAEGLAWADPGARTPIGASGNFYSLLFPCLRIVFVHPITLLWKCVIIVMYGGVDIFVLLLLYSCKEVHCVLFVQTISKNWGQFELIHILTL